MKISTQCRKIRAHRPYAMFKTSTGYCSHGCWAVWLATARPHADGHGNRGGRHDVGNVAVHGALGVLHEASRGATIGGECGVGWGGG